MKPEDLQAVNEFMATISKALADTQITADAATVTAHTSIDIAPPMIGAVLMPALAASREAAMRAQTMNNLKQLALAMYQYEDAYHCLPASARQNKEGTKQLSWRVSILPFLGEKELFEQFHQGEPWDSEHNRKLIEKMPAVFRDPHEDAGSTNASYFMPTGKGTIGEIDSTPGNRRIMIGTSLKDITDGTANTILLVEAKRDIPWTKPEDIEIDPDPAKPLPKLGGHLIPEGLCAAAFADGHVEALFSSGMDQKALHAMFTIAGSDNTGISNLPRPDSAKPSAHDSGSILLKREADGQVAMYWNETRVTDAELHEQIAKLNSPKEQTVSISAERDIPYQDVVHVMDVLKEAGISKITLPTRQPRVRLELHRAETEPGEGLIESAVMGESKKVYLHREAEITNGDIQGASVTTDNSGQPVISVALTVEGAKKMAALSKANLGKPLAIVLDGRVVMAPAIRSEMSGGVAITGNLTKEAAQRIADGLNAK